LIIRISNKLTLFDAPSFLQREIKDRLTIYNPVFEENKRMGRWNGDTPRFLQYYEETPSGLIIPRGFQPQLMGILRRFGQRVEIQDRRRVLPEVDFQFRGQLRLFQQEAVKAALTRDEGTISAPTGSGKTVIALYLIAQRKQPALIIVHTKELLNQWISRINQFLGIPVNEIGRIGDGFNFLGFVCNGYWCCAILPHS